VSAVRAHGAFAHLAYWLSVGTLIALIALTTAWELWLAPLRPGGSWLALKALPLLLAMRGIISGTTYTYGWAMMLVLAYFAEGCVRAYSESPPAATLALAEIVLASLFFAGAIAYVRSVRRPEAPAVSRRT
jgi:uncharacterized membrane protein